MEITKEVACKVIKTVDAGLVNGLGNPTPGEMCVEAAVCYALGLPHGDDPECVAPALRDLKIALNDQNWDSPESRARGLRRLAVAQLGSRGALDEQEFAKRVAEMPIRKYLPRALRDAASLFPSGEHQTALEEAAARCEREGSAAAAAAKAAAEADAAYAAAEADQVRSDFAEDVVQILIAMDAPGCQWLPLTE